MHCHVVSVFRHCGWEFGRRRWIGIHVHIHIKFRKQVIIVIISSCAHSKFEIVKEMFILCSTLKKL